VDYELIDQIVNDPGIDRMLEEGWLPESDKVNDLELRAELQHATNVRANYEKAMKALRKRAEQLMEEQA
jgi:hypothetical protein